MEAQEGPAVAREAEAIQSVSCQRAVDRASLREPSRLRGHFL